MTALALQRRPVRDICPVCADGLVSDQRLFECRSCRWVGIDVRTPEGVWLEAIR